MSLFRSLMIAQLEKEEVLVDRKFIEVTVHKLYDSTNYGYNYIPTYIYDKNYCNGVFTKNANGTYTEVELTNCTYSGIEDDTVAYVWMGVDDTTNGTYYTYYIDVTGYTALHYLGYSSPYLASSSTTGYYGQAYRNMSKDAFYYSKIVIPDNITKLTVYEDIYLPSSSTQELSTLCCCNWAGHPCTIDLSSSSAKTIPSAYCYYQGDGLFIDFVSDHYKNFVGGDLSNYSYGQLSITLPSSCTSISSNSFQYCNLASISIPSTCTSIGNEAFYGCSSLSSITAHNNITSMGKAAFHETAFWSNRTSGTAVTLNNWLLGVYNLNSKKDISISTSITKIAQEAFKENTYLTGINAVSGSSVVDHKITEIGQNAFYGCTYFRIDSLLYDGNTIKTISVGAYKGAGTGVALGSYSGGALTGGNAAHFSSCDTIGSGAFENCTKLQNLFFSKSTTIGTTAFSNCSELCIISCAKGARPAITINSFGSSSTTYAGRNSVIVDSGAFNRLECHSDDRSFFENSNNSYWPDPVLDSTKCKFAISITDADGTTTTTTTKSP